MSLAAAMAAIVDEGMPFRCSIFMWCVIKKDVGDL
jgi:hypothetical protein